MRRELGVPVQRQVQGGALHTRDSKDREHQQQQQRRHHHHQHLQQRELKQAHSMDSTAARAMRGTVVAPLRSSDSLVLEDVDDLENGLADLELDAPAASRAGSGVLIGGRIPLVCRCSTMKA